MDRFNGNVMHHLGLAYKDLKTPVILPFYYPHVECEKVKEIGDCAHLKSLNRTYKNFIKFLEEQVGDGDFPVQFDLNTLIQIKNGAEGKSAKFQGRCQAGYQKGEKRKILIEPGQEMSFEVCMEGEHENPFSYHIRSLKTPRLEKDGLEIKIFHYSDMKDRVGNIVYGDPDKRDFVLDPHLYDIMTVWVLDRVTRFSERGEESFEETIRKEVRKPIEERNDVIMKWVNNCAGLRCKTERFMSELSTRPSSPSA